MALALPVSAESEIIGPAVITDSDNIKIDSQRIHLHGVNAPESRSDMPSGRRWSGRSLLVYHAG